MRKSNLVVANEILSRRAKRSKIENVLYGTLLTAKHPDFRERIASPRPQPDPQLYSLSSLDHK